ncbi:MAG: 23S rRNA (uracil(1939)-C(5))-methyltransferase RlmD [Tissierellaceae bacterium]
MSRRRKKIVEIEIIDTMFPNRSVGKYEDRTIIVKGGIKGQIVKVLLGRKRKDYTEGKILEIIERSPLEKNIGCPHHGICGGCTYQTLSYEDELSLKEYQILELFKMANLEDINFLGIEKSNNIESYRNKMEYTFGDEEKDGQLALGLHKKGRFYEVVNVDKCNIIDNDFTIIRKNIVRYFQNLNFSYYNKRSHEGFLRHLVIRKALSTGEILINLVTTSQEDLNREDFISVVKICSESLQGRVTGIIHTVNDGLGDVVKADKMEILYGRDYIVEEILGLKFKISPFSFFQTNTFGAEKLYSIVREFAGDIDDKIVFDLYSGTGTIAQIMAPVAKKIIGIEIVEEAVEKAKENAELNDLNNIEFIAGDVLKVVDELDERPDLIVIDPPRDGIHPKAIDKIIDFNPEVFVYVSCNPVTLVRDLKVFVERGYRIDKVKCMDMFPRTPHVETVTLLTK